MKPTSRLTLDFAQRMVNDLPTNNTLRGSWAEQLVAHFLGIENLPPNWSYFDMRDASGRDISVKHSVGKKPKFAVAMNRWAWDPGLLGRQPETEGWYASATASFQYWCHTYVFAWLEHETTAPDLDIVLDSDRWRFAVLSRHEMYAKFAPNGEPMQKSVGLTTLGEGNFHPGAHLPTLVANTPCVADPDLVPPRSMIPWIPSGPATPVEDVIPQVVPQSTEI